MPSDGTWSDEVTREGHFGVMPWGWDGLNPFTWGGVINSALTRLKQQIILYLPWFNGSREGEVFEIRGGVLLCKLMHFE